VNDEPIDAEVVGEPQVEPSKELVQHAGSTALIETGDPEAQVAFASKMATTLDNVIKQQGMRTRIGSQKIVQADGQEVWQPKYHVNVEAWQTLATFLGIAAEPVWSRRVIDPETGKPEMVRYTITREFYKRGTKKKDIKNGTAEVERVEHAEVAGYSWESRVEVYRDGVRISAGESMCSRTEETWRERPDYSLRGMAQTRATARAIAGAARWIVTLAGYSATPAEEMPETGRYEEPPEEEPYGAKASDDLENSLAKALAYLFDADEHAPPFITELNKLADGYMPKIVAQAVTLTAKKAKELDEADDKKADDKKADDKKE